MTDEQQLSQTIEAHAPAEYIEVALTAAMQRIAELEAQLFGERQRLVKLSEDADTVLFGLHPDTTPGAINWGDLCAREVQCVWAHDDGVHRYRIVIDEADPVNPALHAAVLAGLAALGWDAAEVEIVTEW